MTKIVVIGGGVVNLWSSFQVSRFTYKNLNISALNYERELEGHAAEKFKEVLSGKDHESPDRIVNCDCHKNSILEIKCPYSICHKSPTDSDVSLSYLQISEDRFWRLDRNHQCYTRCQQQMGVSGKFKCFFCLCSSWILFEGTLFRPGLRINSEKQLSSVYKDCYPKSTFPY